MTKSKVVVALEARLAIAKTVYRDQKARIAELEGLLATRGHIASAPRVVAQPVVTQFTKRDGSVWESTRLGNQTRTRAINLGA